MSLSVDRFKIWQLTGFNEYELEIDMGVFEGTEEEIVSIANQGLKVVLKEDGLKVDFGEVSFLLNDEKETRYNFKICTKYMPPPVDVSLLPKTERLALIEDMRYMTAAEDFESVPFSLSVVYKEIKSDDFYKGASSFSFSSLAYRMEEVRS